MKNSKRTLLFGVVATVFMACGAPDPIHGQNPEKRGQQGPPDFAQLLEKMDADKDGLISVKEAKGPLSKDFATIDTNEDGFISKEEFANAPKKERGQRPPRN